MTYQIAMGHNNAAGLAALNPQPHGLGLRYARLATGLDGSVRADGLYIDWRYNALSQAQYAALLAQCGLLSAAQAQVTITTRDDAGVLITRNARILRPVMGETLEHDRFRLREVIFRLVNIEEVA